MGLIVLDDITYSTTGWNGLAQSNFEKIGDSINYDITKIASATINCQTTTKQNIFTVPTGQIFFPVFVAVRQASATLAGMVDVDFGAGANADDWLQQISLAAFTAVTDYGVLAQPAQAAGPPIVPTKKTHNIAADVWGLKVITGSTGAATVEVDLFGYLVDV